MNHTANRSASAKILTRATILDIGELHTDMDYVYSLPEAREKGFTESRQRILEQTGWSKATLGRKMKGFQLGRDYVYATGRTRPTPVFSARIAEAVKLAVQDEFSDNIGGELKQVDPRRIWPDEATFNRWLAREPTLGLLGEAIGIQLELEAEHQYRDTLLRGIVCKNLIANERVLVENQLKQTDLTALGQLMRDAAGVDAATIVWVATSFSDEVRATLHWLNQTTHGRLNFVGMELEVYRIGNSPIAPKFNVVIRPNNPSESLTRL